MNHADAIEIVAEFSELMPRLTELQLIALKECVAAIPDPAKARRRLTEYALTHEDFNLAGVRLFLGIAEDGRYGRTLHALAEEREALARAQADGARINAMLAPLDPAEMEQLKAAALAEMSPAMAARYGPADPRNQNRRYLRAMMAELLAKVVHQ